MNWIIYGLGIITGVALTLVVNIFLPSKVDKASEKIRDKVK